MFIFVCNIGNNKKKINLNPYKAIHCPPCSKTVFYKHHINTITSQIPLILSNRKPVHVSDLEIYMRMVNRIQAKEDIWEESDPAGILNQNNMNVNKSN